MYVMGKEEAEAASRVIASGQLFRYRGGEGEVDQFEREWAAKIGTEHAVAVTSGTAALICALVGLGIGPGDEVIVPGYTFMATAIAVLAVGALPVIAEVDESLTLDPADAERKVTPRTRALIPVHMNGLPCDLDGVMAVAQRHGLLVLEDACQADGGSYRGRRLGSIGDAGAFSFNYFKIITCGEGGAVVTNSREVYERAVIMHDGGCAFWDQVMVKQTPIFGGCNFRLNEILGAILRVQLGRLDGILAALRAEKRRLREELAGERAFALSPVRDPEGDCATTLGLLFPSGEQARAFMARLQQAGVGCGSPINSGRHVYVNWEPVMNQLGAHHPALDPYRLATAPVKYSPDMCPRTLSALERTVFLGLSATRQPQELAEIIANIKQAAQAA